MVRTLVEARVLIALLIATTVGLCGLHAYPFPTENVFLALIEARTPIVFGVLSYGYAACWFTTPFLAASLCTSTIAIVAYRHAPSVRMHRLPPYPTPDTHDAPALVLGETHLVTKPGRGPAPTWLTIPQRGLYTGVMLLGAMGSGKTSAGMYPYIEQLLRWRAGDRDRKLGGLVLEVKGDFCRQVRSILQGAGRGDDYIEIGLDTGICYNPLHNDLDPYAVAYAIGALMSNVFGKSKEPFWQQAYTQAIKFVIMLRRLDEGYTTIAEVYRHILDDSQIDREIRRLKTTLAEPPEVLLVSRTDYDRECAQAPWSSWFPESPTHLAHVYDADLETYLDKRQVPYRVQRSESDSWAARRHQLEAVERWYLFEWNRLDQRLRSSIVTGVGVTLSLFDDNLTVYRAFNPPRSAYTGDRKLGALRPLEPLDELLESGHVLALKFPTSMNPGLARLLGVMLKLDFQRAVLQRIPRMADQRDRIWRDLLFVCDEYHEFATVGSTDPTGDERTFALSRQARLMPVVATQSISSLRSALPEDCWRTLLQCFRTKLFLATSDDFTAQTAADLCGKRDQFKVQYSFSEAGQGAHISLLTGLATAAKQTLTATKSYTLHHDYIFPPRVFRELQNAEAIALAYDGLRPLPPQYCYMKLNYLDVQPSYFDHLERGAM